MALRVAHIIDSLQWGGAQKLELTFADTIRSHPVELTIISLAEDEGTPVPNDLRALGVRVVNMPAKKALNIQRFSQLIHFLKSECFDVVHTHLMTSNIIGSLAARTIGMPCVASLHNVRYENRNTRSARHRLETWALRYSSQQVIAVGHTIATAHQQRLRGKPIVVVPNAVSPIPMLTLDERIALRSTLIGDTGRLLLIAVGRLVPQKGFVEVINAFAALRQYYPAAALLIVGGGPLYNELAARISALGLTGHVKLLGARNDVPRLLRASDVFVSASHWEGLPIAILEAMAAHLPVVATAVGEVPRVVVEGTGFLVPPHNPSALADALRTMLADTTAMQAMGVQAYRHVMQTYGAKHWVDQLLAIYKQATVRDRAASAVQGQAQ